MEFIYKKCVFILTCLNFSHLRSTLYLTNTPILMFFYTAQNSFWTCLFWWFLVLLPFLVSPLPHQQNVSLWGCFSPGETEKKSLGTRPGEMLFLVKICWTLRPVWAGPLLKHPSRTGWTPWKSFKKVHWSQMPPLQTTPAGTVIQVCF